MRSISMFCLVALLMSGPSSVAQQDGARTFPGPTIDKGRDIDRADFFEDPPPPRDVERDRLQPPKANSDTELKPDDWKPQYRVVLKLTKSGHSTVSRETYSVPRIITEHKAVTREGKNGTITQVVAEENTVIEQRQRQVVSPGTAVLVCDAISVAMDSREEGKGEGFVFETKGRTRLLLGKYSLDCDALTFADGVLSLKATQSAQGVFKMQASEMKFELNIFGVDSSRFDQSVESLVPEQDSNTNPPGVLYESAGAFDGEDRFDNGANDGFSPRQAESDFRESVPFPQGRVDELDNDLGR